MSRTATALAVVRDLGRAGEGLSDYLAFCARRPGGSAPRVLGVWVGASPPAVALPRGTEVGVPGVWALWWLGSTPSHADLLAAIASEGEPGGDGAAAPRSGRFLPAFPVGAPLREVEAATRALAGRYPHLVGAPPVRQHPTGRLVLPPTETRV